MWVYEFETKDLPPRCHCALLHDYQTCQIQRRHLQRRSQCKCISCERLAANSKLPKSQRRHSPRFATCPRTFTRIDGNQRTDMTDMWKTSMSRCWMLMEPVGHAMPMSIQAAQRHWTWASARQCCRCIFQHCHTVQLDLAFLEFKVHRCIICIRVYNVYSRF